MAAHMLTDPGVDGGRSARRAPTALPGARSNRADAGTWAPALTVTLIVGLSLLVGMVGADARWLAALGGDIVSHARIPTGVPFAAAPSAHWHNVTVGAEIVFWVLEAAVGDRGLVFAQAAAVGIAFGILARDARRTGAGGQQTASACLLAAVGGATSLAIVRAQLFSLALFPVLLTLLRGETRSPSRRIWMAPLLLAVWSNLHGAVLVGLAITLTYLALGRLRARPRETILVALLCLGALCANPGGVHAWAYFHGVLAGAAAQRGEGMWGPLSATSPGDGVVIAVVTVLFVRAIRARPAVWEIAVLLLLAAMTVHAARSGIWLVLMLVVPAARGGRAGSPWRRRTVLLGAAAAAAILLAAIRGPTPTGANPATVADAIHLARGTAILAGDIPAEQIALAGGRVWASDPIDAFSTRVQVAYLEWLDGDPASLGVVGATVRVALVGRGTPEAALMQRTPGFHAVAASGHFELFERVPTGDGRPRAAVASTKR